MPELPYIMYKLVAGAQSLKSKAPLHLARQEKVKNGFGLGAV